MTEFAKPTTITGGCLCGSVRYQVDFPADHDFITNSHTCQCTQCRKNSGDLIRNFHSANKKYFKWLSKETFTEYSAAPGKSRGFCGKCGSWVTWSKGSSDMIEFGTGSVDEEFLIGKRDDDGKVVKEGFGMALTGAGRPAMFFAENEINGVTDGGLKGGARYRGGIAQDEEML